MADLTTAKSGDVRLFVQDGGISPAEPYDYYGCLSIDGAEQDQGESDPVYCPSSTQRNVWDIIDQIQKAQGLGTTDFTQRMDRYLRDAWWSIKRRKCFFNMQAVISACTAPDDFTQWESKILFKNTRLTSFALPLMNPLNGDDNAVMDLTGSLEFRDFIEILAMRFGEVGDVTLLEAALDGFYYDVAQCGDCGPVSDGCQKAYVLSAQDTVEEPDVEPAIVHTSDGWSTSSSLDISTLGVLAPSRMAAVGSYLVVISEADESHHYISFDDVDDDVDGWAEVTSGYVAAKGPRALYSKSPNLTFIAGAGGYLYLMTNPTQAVTVLSDGSLTTQILNDIAGSGRTIVAVGNTNAVLVSSNGGRSFSLIIGPAVGVNLTAVDVLSANVWFIGDAAGNLWFTTNGGRTWTETTLPASITAIDRISFVDEVVGYMTVRAGAVAHVYRTTDGGYSWQNGAPSIADEPTATKFNFVAPCGHNQVMVGGLSGAAGTDGVISVAQ